MQHSVFLLGRKPACSEHHPRDRQFTYNPSPRHPDVVGSLRVPSITQETGNLLTAHILYLHSVIPGTYSNIRLHMRNDGLPYTSVHLFSVSLPSVTRSRKRSMWICYAAGLRRVALFCKPCCFCLFPPSSVGLPTASFWSYVVSSIGLSSAPYESYVLLT